MKDDVLPEFDKSVILDGRHCVHSDLKPVGSTPNYFGVTSLISRNEQQEPSGVEGQLCQASPIAFLDLAGQGDRDRQSKPTGQLRGCQPSRHLEERKRVPVHLGNEAIHDTIIEPIGQDRRQQLAGIAVTKANNGQLR